MKIFQLLLIFLLGNCTLSENIQKEESKDYQDTTHNVELVDYEFEERLNSFYDSEPIAYQELQDLYEGEFPEGVSDPKKLRIHWKDARELALAELELQKNIQKWQNADISARPVLVLDRDGGDFYRYYEYRVLRGSKFIGAIRIPAYRRTENFATAEVHVYSSDEKTYTVKPTGWGYHVGRNLILPQDSEFMNIVSSQIKLTDNIIYNVLYRLYSIFDLESKVTPVNIPKTYDQLYKIYNDSSSVMSEVKKPPSSSIKNSVIDATARANTYALRDLKLNAKKSLFKMESLTVMVPRSQEFVKNIFNSSQNSHFLSTLIKIYGQMTYNTDNTTLQKELRDIFWTYSEENFDKEKFNDILLEKIWNMSDELLSRNIKPIIEYPNIEKYRQRDINNTIDNLISTQYYIHTDLEHQMFVTTYSGFYIKSHNITTSIFGKISNASEQENMGSQASQSSQNRNSFDWNNIEEILSSTSSTSDLMGLMNAVSSLTGSVSYWLELINNPNDNVGQWFGQVALGAGTLGFSILFQAIDMKNDVEKANDHLNNILQKLESMLGAEGLKSIGKLLQKLSTLPGFKALGYVGKIFVDYVDNGPNVLRDAFRLVFDQWVIFVLPIPIPTWVHYTQKWGIVPYWQYVLGLPAALTFNLNNILPPALNPTEIDAPPLPEPEPPIVPKGLENYSSEWGYVHYWLQNNNVLAIDMESQQFIHGSEMEITSVFNFIIMLTKQVYIDKIIFNDDGEPTQTNDKNLLNKELERILNEEGKLYIEQLLEIPISSIEDFKI